MWPSDTSPTSSGFADAEIPPELFSIRVLPSETPTRLIGVLKMLKSGFLGQVLLRRGQPLKRSTPVHRAPFMMKHACIAVFPVFFKAREDRFHYSQSQVRMICANLFKA